MAEQSVIVGNKSVNSGNTSGGTQVMERPQQVKVKGADYSGAATPGGSGKAGARFGGLEMEPRAVPFAAVSFVGGLVGLLVANLILGPLAIILGLIGLRAESNRRARAVLGIVLGIADIAVFVFLAAHAGAHHGSLSWSFLGR